MAMQIPEFFNRYARMIKGGVKFTPLVLELHEDDGVYWGVSLTSPNPEPEDYYECRSSKEAWSLKTQIEDEQRGR